ncbi:hypothetical protein [Plasmodium yoelii yoelii]|uniref:Uncharacterized protein n=1 Tax=Plasmodium yoelii yoelii TaxID=73239 RepID=Q7RLQ7_PLAYO|nr:hypothetical protein [Plasmodium yoelii yoelii]
MVLKNLAAKLNFQQFHKYVHTSIHFIWLVIWLDIWLDIWLAKDKYMIILIKNYDKQIYN